MLSVSRRRATAAALCAAAVVALVALPGCTKKGGFFGTECEETVVTGEPGRVVGADGTRQLEMVGHIATKDGGKAVPGLEIEFALRWERSGVVVGKVNSDASGTARHRMSFDDLEFNVRAFGATQPTYSVRWTGRYQVDDVSYCESRGEAPLPVDQLPKP
jgi:hypothetical protein